MTLISHAFCSRIMPRIVTLGFLALFAFPFSTVAQTGGNVTIMGTVMDPSGAVVPGAKIVATEASTGVSRSDVANSSGQFNIPSLPPGTYTVKISAKGFSQSVQTVTLLADQVRNLNVHLQLGAASQEVTVQAAAVAVNTTTPVLSHVMEQTRVINLPLNGRNPADLTVLVPGANYANGHGAQQGDTKQVPGTESISVNGARPDQISYNLDGANNQDILSNTNDPFPFPDALKEFSVQTNSFSAQYGGNAGAVVNVVTKSGTNHWHGDLFEFVRNGAFNARNYFADHVDPLKRNQFGGVVGGPIRKDSSFIFFGYQGTIIRSVNNSKNAILPTPAELSGDFSSASSPVIDPGTGLPYPDQSHIGPVSPVAVALTKYLPISQESSDGSVTYATPIQQNFNEYISRFDQVLGKQDHLFVRALVDRFYHAPSFDGKDLLTIDAGSTVLTQNYAAGYTRVFAPSLVNNLVIDGVRTASDRGQGGKVPQMSDFGVNLFQLPQSKGGIRGFDVSGFFSFGTFTDAKFIRNSYNLRDHMMWQHGRHSFDFGVDYERDQSNIRNTDLENGTFSMTGDTNPGTGNAMASFVLGSLHGFSQTSGDYSDSRQNVIGLFVSDTWKMTPHFTVDLGLRYAPQVPMKEIYGRIQQFRPDAYDAGVHSSVIPSAPAGLFFVGDSYNHIGVPATGETGDFNNFAPRVGFALDPSGTGKTSIRSGGGVFYYTRLPGLFLNDASIVAPFSLRIDPVAPDTGPLSSPLANYPGFMAAFPERYTLKTVPKDVAFPKIVRVYGLRPGISWITPTIYDWNATVEHQLRSDTLLHLSYVGLRGTHLRQDTDLNPGFYTRGSTASLQARRPYQPFGDIVQNANTGASGYNALEVGVEKRPSSGGGFFRPITLLANYTLSRAMDYGLAQNGGITDVGSSLGSGMSIYDPRQHTFDSGYSDFDRRNRVVASYVWNLPGLTKSGAALRLIAGGWIWSGIYTYQSGDALTIMSGKDRSQSGLGGDRANWAGPAGEFGQAAPSADRGGCSSKVTHCVPFLDPAWFVQPPIGDYGDVGKDSFRGPSLWNVDSGLFKDFRPIRTDENFRIEFRGEFFNLFNHPQFSDPSSTVSSGSFGSIRSTVGVAAGNAASSADSRIIQLALKMYF